MSSRMRTNAGQSTTRLKSEGGPRVWACAMELAIMEVSGLFGPVHSGTNCSERRHL